MSNMVTGGQKAFEFVSEQEPGYVLTYVNEVSVPNVAQAALSQYRAALTSLVAASGGSYLNFRTPNVPVIIPSSINDIATASASSVLRDVAALSAVSNLIRLQLVGDLGNLTSLAKAVLMSLQKIAVTVKFSDGSGGRYIMEMNCNYFANP